MENASYGGVLAVAGYVDADFCLPRGMTAVTVTGKFQLGIVDYIWGSGHTVTFDGSLTVDLTQGQIGDAPGYAYDDGCNFVVDYFRFRTLARASLDPGERFRAEPRFSDGAGRMSGLELRRGPMRLRQARLRPHYGRATRSSRSPVPTAAHLSVPAAGDQADTAAASSRSTLRVISPPMRPAPTAPARWAAAASRISPKHPFNRSLCYDVRPR